MNPREVPRLAFTVHPGDGPYLLLVHGFLSSNAQWLLNVEALGDVCRPVTAELWGHGASPAPTEPGLYRPAAYVEQFEAIRKELDTDRWFVGGYSLGAGLTARYVHTYPEHVYGHVMTNSSSAFADDAQVTQWRSGAEQSGSAIERDGLAAIEKIAVHPRRARRLPQPVYDALVRDAKTLDPRGVANAIRETSPNASIRDIAADNPRPALLCCGEHEKRFAPLRDWAVEHMTNLTVAPMNAGHAVNMEDATGFNRAVTRFICECLTSSTR